MNTEKQYKNLATYIKSFSNTTQNYILDVVKGIEEIKELSPHDFGMIKILADNYELSSQYFQELSKQEKILYNAKGGAIPNPLCALKKQVDSLILQITKELYATPRSRAFKGKGRDVSTSPLERFFDEIENDVGNE